LRRRRIVRSDAGLCKLGCVKLGCAKRFATVVGRRRHAYF